LQQKIKSLPIGRTLNKERGKTFSFKHNPPASPSSLSLSHLKKAKEAVSQYGSPEPYGWPGNVLSSTPGGFISISGSYSNGVSPNVYCSIDARRWTQESIFNPIIPNLKSSSKVSSMRIDLFNIIKENFFIPLSFKVMEIIHEPQHVLGATDPIVHLTIIRVLATAKPCERETIKCNKCQRRYRCVTQREIKKDEILL